MEASSLDRCKIRNRRCVVITLKDLGGTPIMNQVGIPSIKATVELNAAKDYENTVCAGRIRTHNTRTTSDALVCFKSKGDCEIMIADESGSFHFHDRKNSGMRFQVEKLGYGVDGDSNPALKNDPKKVEFEIRKVLRPFEASSEPGCIRKLIERDIATASLQESPKCDIDRVGSRGPLGDRVCRARTKSGRRRRSKCSILGGLTGSSTNLSRLGLNLPESVKPNEKGHWWDEPSTNKDPIFERRILGKSGSLVRISTLSRNSRGITKRVKRRPSHSMRGPLGDSLGRDFIVTSS
mmetsp:Transcript_43023/g.71537  ORF Transcript_43023/g.71537 Transcript_43023/m.71537 type:complete len:294 (-) Transcript_43023:198-1079(-)